MKQDLAPGADLNPAETAHEGASEPAERIQVAAAVVPQGPSSVPPQAGFAATPQGPFVPMVPPGAASTTAGSVTAYVLGVDGVVRLPPGTVITAAQVVGNDLHITQPDGSLVVIVNGGVALPAIFVGGLAFSSDVISSLIGLGQQQPASGPAASPAAGPGGLGSAGGE